jgi:NAD(P)-dependent dehydrogenase (short-subunit alcohol dehydrogenase family)
MGKLQSLQGAAAGSVLRPLNALLKKALTSSSLVAANRSSIKRSRSSATTYRPSKGDVSKLEDLDRLWATVKREKGAVDVIVASAGFVETVTLSQATPEHFDKTFGINARGTFFTVQKALPLLRNNGSIVLVASCVSNMGIPMYTTYGATKAAMRSFARSWAAELKDRGIRVNTLSPGATDTPIIDGQFTTKEEADGAKKMFAERTPLGRIGKPEELAAAALFLASSESSYTTGIDLVCDGGMTQI